MSRVSDIVYNAWFAVNMVLSQWTASWHVPWTALFKGLFMTVALVTCSRSFPWFIAVTGAYVLSFRPRTPWTFRLFSCVFWPVMEIVILDLARGGAWTYHHEDIGNIPLYLFPLWGIVADCIVEFHGWFDGASFYR